MILAKLNEINELDSVGEPNDNNKLNDVCELKKENGGFRRCLYWPGLYQG